MDKDIWKILAASLLIVLGTGTAMAQGQRGGPNFADLDADGSGEITAEDLTALRESRFAELDTDGDGSVSKAEFVAREQARAAERAERMFDRLDADGDGTLSRDVIEMRGRGRGAERMIERFDADNSGGISAEEFDEARAAMAERRKGGERGFGKRRN